MTANEAIKYLEYILADEKTMSDVAREAVEVAIKALEENSKLKAMVEKYEYHIDHTDCIWYRLGECPVTCGQYRDGWNDAMNYIFKNGEGYKPHRKKG